VDVVYVWIVDIVNVTKHGVTIMSTFDEEAFEQCWAKCHKEYDDFMKDYNIKHEVCPHCGMKEYGSTLCGYVLDIGSKDSYKDLNKVFCKCGHSHVVHDRISVMEFKNKTTMK